MSIREVTTHVSSVDGTIYLRTQEHTATQIAEALRPYVGRSMTGDLPNLYGYYHRYFVTLLAVGETTVTVRANLYDYEATLSAGDVFGSHCTTIEAEEGWVPKP